MNITEFLPTAIGDPKRRAGERRIRPHKDQLVYVEGWGDANILEGISKNNRLKFVKHETNDRLHIGKKGVIRLAGTMPEKVKAIVDMDYDFAGNQIKATPNVKDTRVKCCLQSYLVSDDEWLRLIPPIARHIFRNDVGKRNEFNSTISEKWNQIHQIAKERTFARLFRGWFFRKRPRDAPRKGRLPSLDDYEQKGSDAIHDLIPAEFMNDYKRFKSTHNESLQKVGFNDHSLEEVLIPYTNVIDSTKSADEIARKISKAIENYLFNERTFSDIQQLIFD